MGVNTIHVAPRPSALTRRQSVECIISFCNADETGYQEYLDASRVPSATTTLVVQCLIPDSAFSQRSSMIYPPQCNIVFGIAYRPNHSTWKSLSGELFLEIDT